MYYNCDKFEKDSHTYLLDKTVKMTQDIRPPKKGRESFGEDCVGSGNHK